jgi:hypothetical protein
VAGRARGFAGIGRQYWATPWEQGVIAILAPGPRPSWYAIAKVAVANGKGYPTVLAAGGDRRGRAR